MSISLIKSQKKVLQNLNSFDEIVKYLNLKNREIRLNTITPLIADNIDTLIRFWNIEDEELKKSFAEREPIKIYINSLGGSLDAAITIIDAIQMSRTPIYTFNTETVQKESFLIYLSGHKRLAYVNSNFMYSDTILLKELEDKNLDESNFYGESKVIDERGKSMKRMFLDKVNITESQYDKHNKKELWFTAEDALKLHICNEISRRHFHYVKQKN